MPKTTAKPETNTKDAPPEAKAAEEKKPEPTLKERADGGEPLTPAECAEVAGLTNPPMPHLVEPHWSARFKPEHLAAAQLHGWVAHSRHTAEPMRLKFTDYEEAIKCAAQTDKDGKCCPHQPALSQYSRHCKDRKAN